MAGGLATSMVNGSDGGRRRACDCATRLCLYCESDGFRDFVFGLVTLDFILASYTNAHSRGWGPSELCMIHASKGKGRALTPVYNRE
jgi:hypothetical protein